MDPDRFATAPERWTPQAGALSPCVKCRDTRTTQRLSRRSPASQYPPSSLRGGGATAPSLAKAAQGEAFILQRRKFALRASQSFRPITSGTFRCSCKWRVVQTLLPVPFVKIGRYGVAISKPRSSDEETREGVTLPCYRVILSTAEILRKQRAFPDPARMETGYFHSVGVMKSSPCLCQWRLCQSQ